MKTASVAQLQENVASYLDAARRGESVLITDGDVPVARLEPVPATDAGEVGEVKRKPHPFQALLDRPPPVADGGGSTRFNSIREFLESPLPEAKSSVLDALLQERSENR